MREVWYAGPLPILLSLSFSHSSALGIHYNRHLCGNYYKEPEVQLHNASQFLVRIYWILELNALALDILNCDAVDVEDSGLNRMACTSLSLSIYIYISVKQIQ